MKAYHFQIRNIEVSVFLNESTNYEDIPFSPPHLHALPELFVILGGSAELSCDSERQTITDCEACIIPPRIFHSVVTEPSYRRLSFQFALHPVAGSHQEHDLHTLFADVLSRDKPYVSQVSPSLIEAFYACLKQNSNLYEERLIGLLSLIYIEIADHLLSCPVSGSSPAYDSSQDRTNLWLAKNEPMLYAYSSGKASINDLCSSTHFTCRQLSRIVSNEYGMNLVSLRCETRMRQAMFYLTHTQMPVSEIAESLFFSSQESFSISFKRYFGHSPSAIRKQQ